MGSASSSMSANPAPQPPSDPAQRYSDEMYAASASSVGSSRRHLGPSSMISREGVPIERAGIEMLARGSVPDIRRGQSIGTSLGVRLARVDLAAGEKEEGEISDGEDDGGIVNRYDKPLSRPGNVGSPIDRRMSPQKSPLNRGPPVQAPRYRSNTASSGQAHRPAPPMIPTASASTAQSKLPLTTGKKLTRRSAPVVYIDVGSARWFGPIGKSRDINLSRFCPIRYGYSRATGKLHNSFQTSLRARHAAIWTSSGISCRRASLRTPSSKRAQRRSTSPPSVRRLLRARNDAKLCGSLQNRRQSQLRLIRRKAI